VRRVHHCRSALFACACALAPALDLAAPAAANGGDVVPQLRGGVAYTGVHRFDYNKDGTRNRVQFYLIFEARPAVGKEGEPGYLPEAGTMRYRVYDLDTGAQVDSWNMGFNMGFPPADRPYPLSNIAIHGNTATFEANAMSWTIVDGGEGYEKDVVEIGDGVRKRAMKLHGGDLRVGVPK
jgi:hypothetical protein